MKFRKQREAITKGEIFFRCGDAPRDATHHNGIPCFQTWGGCQYLANKFDFDGATLTEALRKTFENRGHHFTVNQFEQVMTFGSDDAMQKKWKAFCRKIDTKTDNFDTVLRTIKVFLTEPYNAAVENIEFTQRWSASNEKWESNGGMEE